MTSRMPEPRHNLLVESLIRVEVAKRELELCTLPGVLERLAQDRVAAFKGLQAHQRHAWYAFLVQLAAIALHRGCEHLTDQGEERWRELLRGLTGGRDEPWCLVVPDLAQPAFFQPPVPEGTLDGFKPPVTEPDELDILVTSRNHDVKSGKIRAATEDQWVYLLVSLQTTQGYSGSGKYGIARMNGRKGSRPCVALAPSLKWGERFRRDCGLLDEGRDVVVDDYGYARLAGRALLWMEPWDGGESSLGLEDCDPYFIEVCQRIRLVTEGDRVAGRVTTTCGERLLAQERKGDTGDPWTPVDREGSALTIRAGGFTYDLMQQLLLGNTYQAGIAGEKTTGDAGDILVVASALGRGRGAKGGTEGFHERLLPVPPEISVRLGRPDDRARLGLMSQRRVDAAATMRRDVLRPALRVLVQTGDREPSPTMRQVLDKRTESWLLRFDASVDAAFFENLWHDADVDDAEGDRRWHAVLRQIGQAQLEAAISSVPLPSALRYRAIAGAERRFWALAVKHLPQDPPVSGGA